MKYNFDMITDRRNTNSLKYDFAKERDKPEDVLPLWVADMDFPAATPIIEKLEAAVRHGIFGYSEAKGPYFDAVQSWMSRHFQWDVQKDWLVKTPGVVFALAAAIRAFTRPGEGVMIQQPVYYPFREVIRDNDRTLVNSSLRLIDGQYEMNFEDIEEKFRHGDVRLFLLCSPHNPVGRVWTEEELRKIGDLCLKYHFWSSAMRFTAISFIPAFSIMYLPDYRPNMQTSLSHAHHQVNPSTSQGCRPQIFSSQTRIFAENSGKPSLRPVTAS